MSIMETKDRALTLDEAVSVAIHLQQNEQWEAADLIYQKVLEAAPAHAEAMHYAGVLAHQRGRSDEAIVLMERSLSLSPKRADWHSNLGIVFRDRLRLEDAIAQFRRAVALDPEQANALSNLGVVLRAQGHLDEAEASYRAAIRVAPNHVDAYTNLGLLMKATGRMREAVMCLCKVLTLRPGTRSPAVLALAHCALGEVDKATAVFRNGSKRAGQSPSPGTCCGVLCRDVPARARMIRRQTFDSFAASFDSKLAQLLRAPELVADAGGFGREASKSLDVLDVGCGTGLCGPLLPVRALVGVDSRRDAGSARARKVYDELIKGELTAFLGESTAAYDVILSADTLVYFGALEVAARRRTRCARAGS